jgi:transposase
MGHLQGAHRPADIPCPERLDDDIAEEQPVRLIDAFLDDLHREALGLQRATPATTGRPASHPAALLPLSMDGSLSRLRSRRRLAQAPHRHVELRWLVQKWRPAHQTLADVRTNHLQPLRPVCRACTWLGQQLALVAGARVALDGSTCQAGNAKARHCTRDTLQKLRGPSAHRVAESLTALDRRDHPEEAGTPGGAAADHGQAKREALQPRQHLDAGLQAQREASGAAPLALTDPASRALPRGHGRGTAVCSTVQPAVDAQPQRRIAHDVTNAPGDRAGLRPRALQATDVRGCPGEAVADRGSDHGEAVQTCRDAGLTPSLARPLTSAHQKRGLFRTEDCPSDGATDPSQCPAGEQRTFRLATIALERAMRSEATSACQGGALQPPCTRHPGGRRLTRGVEEHRWEEMEQRGRRRPEVRKQRKPLVEPPCGTLQRGGSRAPVGGVGWRRYGRRCAGRCEPTIAGGSCTSLADLGCWPLSARAVCASGVHAPVPCPLTRGGLARVLTTPRLYATPRRKPLSDYRD